MPMIRVLILLSSRLRDGNSENTAVFGSLIAVILAFGKLRTCQEIGKIYNEFGKLGPADSAHSGSMLDWRGLYFL
jgi:hypothetical protein